MSGNGLRCQVTQAGSRSASSSRLEAASCVRSGFTYPQTVRRGARHATHHGAGEPLSCCQYRRWACRAWSLVIPAESSASSGSARSAMSRSVLAWQARLVNAYCPRQSSGVRSVTATARSSNSSADVNSCIIPNACACAGEKISHEEARAGRDRLAPGVGEHADVHRGHRNPDRHFIEPEPGPVSNNDSVITDGGGDETARKGVPVHGRHGRARVSKEAHIGIF